MTRVAACTDCGARFKVPDSTTASKAKCPKCGGVLEIPSSGDPAPAPAAPKPAAAPKAPTPRAAKAAAPAPRAAAPAKAPVAPSKAAPAKASRSAPAPAKAGASKSRRAAGAAGKSGARSAAKGSRAAKSGGGRRGKGAGEAKSGGSPALLIGILAVVILGGGAAWWFLKDDGAATSPAADGTPSSASSTTAPAGDTSEAGASLPAGSGNSGAGQPVITPPEPLSNSGAAGTDPTGGAPEQDSDDGSSVTGLSALDALTSAAATAGDDDQAAAPEVTQAAAAKSSKDEDLSEPRPTLIEFEPFGPTPGTSQADFEAWSKLVLDLYVTDGGAAGRSRKRLKAELDEVDIVNATPAYINACIGLDIKDEGDLQVLFILVRDWQERVGSTPRFYFNGDVTDRTVVEQNKRLIVVDGWSKWWSSTIKTEDSLATYRAKMEERRDG